MMLTWMIGSYLSGKLLAQYGAKWAGFFGVSGLLLTAIGLTMLRDSTPVIYIYLLTAIQGLGFGIVLTLCTLTVQSMERSLRGVATASNVFFRSLGQATGVSLLGTYFYVIISRYLNRLQVEDVELLME